MRIVISPTIHRNSSPLIHRNQCQKMEIQVPCSSVHPNLSISAKQATKFVGPHHFVQLESNLTECQPQPHPSYRFIAAQTKQLFLKSLTIRKTNGFNNSKSGARNLLSNQCASANSELLQNFRGMWQWWPCNDSTRCSTKGDQGGTWSKEPL